MHRSIILLLVVLLLATTSTEAIRNPLKEKNAEKFKNKERPNPRKPPRPDQHDKRHRAFGDKMNRLFDRARESGEYDKEELAEMRTEIGEHTARRKELNMERKRLARETGEESSDELRSVMREIKKLDDEHQGFFDKHKDRIKPKRAEKRGKKNKASPLENMSEAEKEERRERGLQDRRRKSEAMIEKLWQEAQSKKGDGEGDTFSDDDLEALRAELDEWLAGEAALWSEDVRPNLPVGLKPDERSDEQHAAVKEHKELLKEHKEKREAIVRRVRGEL